MAQTEDQPSTDLIEEIVLDQDSADFVARIIDVCMVFMDMLVGHSLRPYQVPFARRILESLIIEDAEELTALFARQSGKSESVCNTVAVAMILFPRLAKIYPERMGKYKDGLWVGIFAPTEGQAETLFGRLVSRLSSERATDILQDPEINDKVDGRSGRVTLTKCGSFALMMTANPRAKIESKTFHIALLDEAQDCFPAETPVLTSEGWVPIGEIVNGNKRDWVVAAQDCDDKLLWSSVRTAYRTPRHSNLVRVDHELGSLYCTANHPFVVGDARVPAGDLSPGTPLLLVSGSDQPPVAQDLPTRDHSRLSASLLARDAVPDPRSNRSAAEAWGVAGCIPCGCGQPGCFQEHDRTEPHALRGDSAEGGQHPAEDWAPPQGAGREWSRDDRATAAALGDLTRRLGGRACLPRWRGQGEGRTPDALQGGPFQPQPEAGGRGGWVVSQGSLTAGAGPLEDPVARESRVLRVEVLEQGSAEFAQFSDGADWVYTLEVDADSHTFVAAGVLVGNCDDYVVRKSIHPMMTAVAGTIVKTGTPTTRKGDFYQAIQLNKRRQLERKSSRRCHFEADWREVAKWNPAYKKAVSKEMERMGEDSDEFQMSFNLKWLLERGMFTTSTRLDELGDTSMQELVKAYNRTPVIVGIDPARLQDSTVVTVAFVDWDRPDEFGFYPHRILNWLELVGMDWEEQYFHIQRFLDPYNIHSIGVDAQGVGDAVAQRLSILLRNKGCEVIPLRSNSPDQSARWKHLMTLMDRGLIGWPAGAKVRRLRTYSRFYQQMSDAEKIFQGPNVLVRAPDEAHAHDDYVDSLALCTWLTAEFSQPESEMISNPFFR